MTIRRVLYPALFFAVPPVAAAAAPTFVIATSVEPVVAFRNIVISDNPVPPRSPTVAPPVFAQSPERPVSRSFPVALAPYGAAGVGVITPAAVAAFKAAEQVDAFVVQTSVVITDSPLPPRAPAAPVQPYGAFPQDPIKVAYGFPAKLMQDGSDLVPFPPPVALSVFQGSPERFVKANSRVQWHVSDFADRGAIVSVTPQGWMFQPPVQFAAKFKATLQRFQDFAPTVVSVVQVTATFSETPFVSLQPVIGDDMGWSPLRPAVAAAFTALAFGPDQPFATFARTISEGMGGTAFVPAIYAPFPYDVPNFVKPLAAAQQRFSDFVRAVVSVTPQGFWTQFPALFTKPFPAKLQWARDDWPSSPIFVATPAFQGFYFQWPERYAPKLAATQQRFGDFEPAGTIVSVTPQGWWGRWPDQFTKPYNVSLQHPIGFAPAGDLVSTPQGWWGQSPVLFWKATYPAFRQQDGSDFVPIGTIVTPVYGWQYQWPDLFVKPFPAKLQWDASDFAAQGTIVSTTPQGWMFQDPEQFVKPLRASQQRFQDFTPAGFILITPAFTQTPYFQYPDIFAKKFPAAQQRFQDFVPLGTIVSTTPQGWWGQPPALFVKPVAAALQRFASDGAPRSYIFTAAIFSQWPEKFWKANYPAYLQQRGEATLFVPTVTPADLGAYFQWPERFIRPLAAKLQRFQDFTPRGTIVSVTPQGWMFQQPVLFGRRFPVAEQKFTLFEGRFVPTVTPSFFSWTYSPERFVRPLKAAEQMFTGWMPFRPTPPVFVPQLRGAYDPPVRFIKPYPAALQQFEGYQPFGTIFAIVSADGLKNEIIRVRWLENEEGRFLYLKNEVERCKTLPTRFEAALPMPIYYGWLGGGAWTVSVKEVTYKVWLYPYSGYLS